MLSYGRVPAVDDHQVRFVWRSAFVGLPPELVRPSLSFPGTTQTMPPESRNRFRDYSSPPPHHDRYYSRSSIAGIFVTRLASYCDPFQLEFSIPHQTPLLQLQPAIPSLASHQ